MSMYTNLEIASLGNPLLSNNILDTGEPQCMACGKNWSGKYDMNKLDSKRDSLDKVWEKVPLKQAIILDFGDYVENERLHNLILLCDECLENRPDVDSMGEFVEWANGRGCLFESSYNKETFSSTKNAVSVTKEERLLLKVVREYNVDIEVFLLLLMRSELISSGQKQELLSKVLRPQEAIFRRKVGRRFEEVGV